jgi:hypothetical protein
MGLPNFYDDIAFLLLAAVVANREKTILAFIGLASMPPILRNLIRFPLLQVEPLSFPSWKLLQDKR